MARELNQIAFVVGEFNAPSPEQQLLDRFLLGYPRDGRFYQAENCRITVCSASGANDREINRRMRDFGLNTAPSIETAVAKADAIVVVRPGAGETADDAVLQTVVKNARPGTPCFVRGNLATGAAAARRLTEFAASRQIPILAGGTLGVTWRLPEIPATTGKVVDEALIVVQGASAAAEFEGLDGLSPIIEGRRGRSTRVRRMRCLEGAGVWRAANVREWSWPLLAAAISRSDSPRGDPVKDGRTQDLVGLGLVPKLATAPRAWLIEFHDGLRCAILALDGVIADVNLAFRGEKGRIMSTQLYRPPPPGEHEFSRLAERVEAFFRGGTPPWPLDRGAFVSELLEARAAALEARGKWVENPVHA